MTVAVVDRMSDINQAAQALVHARFAYKGRSAYAPDLVLVNEFVMKDFLQAAVRYSLSIGEGLGIASADKLRSLYSDGCRS